MFLLDSKIEKFKIHDLDEFHVYNSKWFSIKSLLRQPQFSEGAVDCSEHLNNNNNITTTKYKHRRHTANSCRKYR